LFCRVQAGVPIAAAGAFSSRTGVGKGNACGNIWLPHKQIRIRLEMSLRDREESATFIEQWRRVSVYTG
jgi:hypothetical protein